MNILKVISRLWSGRKKSQKLPIEEEPGGSLSELFEKLKEKEERERAKKG